MGQVGTYNDFMVTNTSRGRSLIDITGTRVGNWTVLRLAEIREHKAYWLCRCDCGKEAEVVSSVLRKGQSKSCGCMTKRRISDAVRTHGGTGTPEHRVWKSIITRCCNPKARCFPRYGGRGIRICERWRSSFAHFLADVGARPSVKHQIEREDNDGDYEPGNCRWATDAEQRRNKRTNRFVEHDGLRLTITDWSKRTGIDKTTLRNRILRGWPASRALTEAPVDYRRR